MFATIIAIEVNEATLEFLLQEVFEKNVVTLRGTRYIPKVIVFYAYWGRNVEAYLSAFKRSVEEFHSLDIALEFGLVDLAQEAGKKCNQPSPDLQNVINKFWVGTCISKNSVYSISFKLIQHSYFLIWGGGGFQVSYFVCFHWEGGLLSVFNNINICM